MRVPFRSMLPWAATALILSGCDGDGTGPEDDLLVTTEALPDGAVGQPYSEGIVAEGGGGGYEWELTSGSVPAGLELGVADLSDDELVITGIPETEGTSTFTLQVSSRDGQVDSVQLALRILPPPSDLIIDNLALPPTVVGGEVEIPLRTADGAGEGVDWAVVDGSLPPGLRLGPDGVITGTATAEGEFEFTVRVRRGGDRSFERFTIRVVPDDTSRFRLTGFPVVAVPEAIRPHVDAAIELWESVLVGDLTGGTIPGDFFGAGGCGGFGQEANGAAIDDVLVLINIDSIDGPGRVLAQAGPCGLRDDDLPFIGVLTLDSEDLLPITGSSTLTAVVAHEIGHVLGFGALWQRTGLIQGQGGDDPVLIGEGATAEWEALGGTGSVPVENEGGQGTRDSHLRESVFGAELMTGFSEPVGVTQPLSRVSVAAMADLGYTVDLAAAQAFSLADPLVAPGRSTRHLGWDIVGGIGPVRTLRLGARPSRDRVPRPPRPVRSGPAGNPP